MIRSAALVLVAVLARSVWAAPSTTHMWFSAFPAWGSTAVASYGGSGAMDCVAWVPTVGITNATAIAWYTGAANSGGLCSTAVFDTSGNKLLDSGAVTCVAAGAKIATGLTAASFAAGQKYYVCTCANASAAAAAYLTSNNGGDVTNLANALSVPQLTRAGNTCTNGVMPATAGGFTSANINAMIVLFATSTP